MISFWSTFFWLLSLLTQNGSTGMYFNRMGPNFYECWWHFRKTTKVSLDQKSLTLQSTVGHRVLLLQAGFEILGQWFTVDSKGVVRPIGWLTPGVLFGNLPFKYLSTGQTLFWLVPLRWHYSDAIGKNNIFVSYNLNTCTAR